MKAELNLSGLNIEHYKKGMELNMGQQWKKAITDCRLMLQFIFQLEPLNMQLDLRQNGFH